MINLIIKYSITTFIFLFISISFTYSAIETKILYKINNEIITNIDVENEKKFLFFLNPKLKNLSDNQIEKISKDSLKNRKIKEIELEKYFDLNEDENGKKYIDNFVANSNYVTEKNLIKKVKEFNLEYKYFKNNFFIDNLWREFIFTKFKSKIKIDTDSLRKQIENQDYEIEELHLSEILFKVMPNQTFEELIAQIKTVIKKSGFEAAASIFSISESKNFGGEIGWIKSNQISKKIYSEIRKTKVITSPIKTSNGYLIIKINEKRIIKEKVNLDDELQKLINIETDKELNKLGYIYFNKIKKRTFISEK